MGNNPIGAKLIGSSHDDPSNPVSNSVVHLNGGCTGTLITPNIVITAGHCFDGETPPPGFLANEHAPVENEYPVGSADWEDKFQWYSLSSLGRLGPIEVLFGNLRDTPIHRATISHFCIPTRTDMLMLRLRQPVPSNIARPSRVLTSPTNATLFRNFIADKNLFVVGWGAGDSLRTVRQRANARLEQFPTDFWGSTDFHMGRISVLDGASIAGGDSGGPLFCEDPSSSVRYLLGIIQSSGGTFSATQTVSEFTVKIGEWIQRQAFARSIQTVTNIYLDSELNRDRFESINYNHIDTSDNKKLVKITGVALLDFSGNSTTSWLTKTVELDLKLPPETIRSGQRTILKNWAPFVSISSMLNRRDATNNGVSVDNFEIANPLMEHFDYIRLRFNISARDTDALILRANFKITLLYESL